MKIDGQFQNDLAVRLRSAFEQRVGASSGTYTPAEIERVSTLSRKLFSEAIDVPAELLEPIRAAASLSNCELRPNPDFTSHRPIIGVVIVFFKKLTWPLIRFHLHRQFDALREFNGWLLYSQAKVIESQLIGRK